MAEQWNPFSTVATLQQITDTAAEGSDPRPSRADHKHSFAHASAPSAVTPDASAAAGSGAAFSANDHQHGIVTYASAPAVDNDTTGAAGTSGTAPARGDHKHGHGAFSSCSLHTNYGEKSTANIWTNTNTFQSTTISERTATTTIATFFRVTTDADHRLEILADGTLKWGDGTNGVDTVLNRSAADVLNLANGDSFTFGPTATKGRLDSAGFVQLPEISAPSTPASGFGRFYAGTDNKGHYIGDDGTDTAIAAQSAPSMLSMAKWMTD